MSWRNLADKIGNAMDSVTRRVDQQEFVRRGEMGAINYCFMTLIDEITRLRDRVCDLESQYMELSEEVEGMREYLP